MKIIFIILILFLTINELKSQIYGLSPSYINAFSPNSLTKNTLEFEPSFLINYINSEFDDNAKIKKIDSSFFNNQFGFRFTYGLLNRLEIGFFIPSHINYSCFGFKINLVDKEKYGLGLIGGINNDFEATNVWQQWAAGFTTKYSFSKKIKSEFNAQYSHDFQLPTSKNFHIIIDNAYESEIYNFVLSLNYDRYFADNSITENFQICPAVVCKAELFYASFFFPISLYGRNNYNYKGFGFALTIPMF